MSRALDTNPGTSLDVVVSIESLNTAILPQPMERIHLFRMQERRPLCALEYLLMSGAQESTRPVSAEDVLLIQIRCFCGRTITGTGLKKWRPALVHKSM